MKLYEELQWRGLVDNITSPDLIEKLNSGRITFYIGTDPTADSLHIGHFSSLLTAKRLKEAGHNPIILVGGATGLIGDPKPNTERPMITKESLNYNYEKLRAQIGKLFGFEMVNNYDWSKDINFIDYLRDYGKYFSLNYMLNKETVKSRLEIGITYTEFSYMIMQALDFLILYKKYNCTLQIGGQDQWGNITAGVELIRKKIGAECYGLTMPLITKADGTKFGKSEGGTVWLDETKTSPYELYQFLINSEDEKVIEYLKKLTFLSRKEIEALEVKVKEEPHLRLAQKSLAEEVVTFIHGKEAYDNAVRISEILFEGKVKELSGKEIKESLSDVLIGTIKEDSNIVDLLADKAIATSKREARELIESGAITINGDKTTSLEHVISVNNAIDKKYTVIRRGKKKYYLIEHI
ncbi:MAG: tyrosine--tRNA ligase [Bacilli bacterium]|nr:tyrosine--tRNA ligase [Bacilli bacterium]MDD3304879.1 tyrosine--tRNA ligase [Bacilli bacterium]MDD4053521.1 tyrosine--tRNA ligase [Bacilli bacterium]MDD4411556.1 tyrosine--tRNA ligase [Bacilli bacterium]